MRRYFALAFLFFLVPAIAFGATATSTGSGKWSEAIWSGGAGDGGAPADGDAVTIAEGHSVLMDADLSGWTGITTLTITGSAASTPGMLYFKNGTNGYLKFATGGSSTYGIVGTNVANKGRLLANANGDWDNATSLTFANKAIIDLGGTTTAAASATIYAQYLDIKLLAHEPTNKSVTVYYDKYAVAESGINTTTNVITLASAHGWSANRAVKVRTTGTFPAPLSADGIYYVGSPSGADLKLLYTSGGTEVDLTSAGSGTIEIYSGYDTYAGVSQVNILEDVTADTGWIATDGHDAVVLADIGPAEYDQQRTAIASIDSATQITLAAALDSAQYPGAKIWLSSRNVSIRSSASVSSHNIITTSTGNTFGCEIKNTQGTGTTFYSSGFYYSNNNTISGTISGCNSGFFYSSNNTISGTISGCSYGLYYSFNNNISGTISGCCYGFYYSNNNTISGTITGCSYDIRGRSIGNIIINGRTAGDLTYYSDTRNTQGVEMRLGVESWLYAIGTDFVRDAWGDVDRVTHASPRTGGSASVIRATAQSNIASYAKDGLLLFAHRIYIPASGSRTITYYAQTDYTEGLTSDQVKLVCYYEDNETDTHRTSVTSTQAVTVASGTDDWDQYLQVTVVPGHASFVDCEARLYAYESGKYLYIDPMLVTTGQTVIPSWQYGESKVNVYATPAGGGGKWVY